MLAKAKSDKQMPLIMIGGKKLSANYDDSESSLSSMIKSPGSISQYSSPKAMSNNDQKSFLSKFNPVNSLGKNSVTQYLRGTTLVDGLKLRMMKKTNTNDNHDQLGQLIDKINKRMDSGPEIQKQRSVMELRKAMKKIKTVVEDNESEEE